MEISSGHTPDISKFRFHIWEPVWYFEPTKSPIDSWKKGRWLGFAHSTGDVMKYYVETAETGRKPQVLMRSSVISRSQHQDNPTNDLSNQTQKHTTSGELQTDNTAETPGENNNSNQDFWGVDTHRTR